MQPIIFLSHLRVNDSSAPKRHESQECIVSRRYLKKRPIVRDIETWKILDFFE